VKGERMTATGEHVIEYVTAMIGGQLFGLPIERVQDVFMPERLTRVPLAATEIAGLLNLRGRIVTVVDMRRRLAFEALESAGAAARMPGRGETAADGAAADAPAVARRPCLAVGIEHKGESYGLLIDQIGEVLKLPAAGREDNPVNLDPGLGRVSAGVHRLDGRLLVVLDVERVLDVGTSAQAA
jgi:purine-binding chemotaxis protein CheW